MRIVGLIGALSLMLLGQHNPAYGFEEFSDLSASVEVAEAFEMNLSNPALPFPYMRPAEVKVLGEGSFHHEVTVRSNNGRPWYVKAELVSLKHVGTDYQLPSENLKWQISEVIGDGTPPRGYHAFEPFQSGILLIYAGQNNDLRGQEVKLRFQYSLTCPVDAPAGDYMGEITFTLSETP